MILKALYDYYNRCGDLAPKGYEYKELGFLIDITKEGVFRCIEDCRIDKKHCNIFLIPQTVSRSGSKAGMFPCLMWDNVNFVLGVQKDEKPNAEGQYLDAFKAKVKELADKYPNSDRIGAVNKFYSGKSSEELLSLLSSDSLYQDLIKTNKGVSFRIEGDTKIVAEDESLKNEMSNEDEYQNNGQLCMVTGKKAEIARIHHKTPLPGAAFAALISFQKSSGYDSYGKEQAFNAPISVEAEFAYTSALNTLLGKDSKNKFVVGERTFLFWASNANDVSIKAEQSIFDMFSNNDEDNPNAKIDKVRKVFNAIYSGEIKTSLDDKFYILGITPNVARVAVVYWSEILLRDFAKVIIKHFNDMDIVNCRENTKPYYGLYSILSAVALNGEMKNVAPNLAESVIKSMFQGYPYPETLYTSCLRRIKAEISGDKNPVRIARAAIIKAYLNRLNNNNKKIDTMLDKENSNQGYLCGRLFAVLDMIQYAANRQNSIRSSYMNAASTTPATVFGRIMSLSNAHIKKLSNEKPGLAHFFESMKGEILGQITANGFPAHLNLEDQGRFFVGYYHQINHNEDNNNI